MTPYQTYQRDYQKKYRAENKGKIKALQQRWRGDRANRVRDRLRRLGLDYSLVEVILTMPQICGICGSEPNGKDLHIDHDHATGAFRGLLCHSCNVGIGHFKEDPEVLDAAKRYLLSRFDSAEKIPGENRFNQ